MLGTDAFIFQLTFRREMAAMKPALLALLSSNSLSLLPVRTTGIRKKDTSLSRPDLLEHPTIMHSTMAKARNAQKTKTSRISHAQIHVVGHQNGDFR